MKKIVLLFSLVLMLVVLSGCQCEHVWSDATCSVPKACTLCEETEGEPLGHVWSEATCTQAKACARCAETDGKPLAHNWLDATREFPKTCADCAATEGERLTLEEAYPDGKLRFKNGRFQMNTEDFLQMYLNDLTENGYKFVDTGVSQEVSEGYVKYFFLNEQEEKLSIAVITDTDTGLIYMISVGCELDLDNLSATQALMDAAAIAYETCHGAMDDTKWDELFENMEIGYINGSLAYRCFCDDLSMIIAVSDVHYEVITTPDLTQEFM